MLSPTKLCSLATRRPKGLPRSGRRARLWPMRDVREGHENAVRQAPAANGREIERRYAPGHERDGSAPRPDPKPAAARVDRESLRCFCGKAHANVRDMVCGPTPVAICNECVELCREIMFEQRGGPTQAA
ncbi:MAG: ClpX C4-type zinc finger protein [Solirubrobacteraceae bacterium]